MDATPLRKENEGMRLIISRHRLTGDIQVSSSHSGELRNKVVASSRSNFMVVSQVDNKRATTNFRDSKDDQSRSVPVNRNSYLSVVELLVIVMLGLITCKHHEVVSPLWEIEVD